jgi:alkanesulfonate monooxygenase SsuD/methylene tetrahydromethanopterin reductase-like flavin-dependent oxidoreductase (luciferase family)
VAYEPSRIKKIEFEGQFHRLSATQQTHPSPQRVPVLFQAGSSKSGIALAGSHAEGIFCGSLIPGRTASYMKDVRAAAAAAGRDPATVKSFAGLSTFIAPTLEEAQAKYERAAKLASPEAGLAKFGGYTNIDLSQYPLDEPFEIKEGASGNAIKGIIEMFKAGDGSNEAWTPRKLGTKMSLGSLYPIAIGTPEMVADFMEKWIAEADIDGFNLYGMLLSPPL